MTGGALCTVEVDTVTADVTFSMVAVEYHFIGDIVKIVHKIRRSAPNKIEKIKWDIIHKFIDSENTDKPIITSTVATH